MSLLLPVQRQDGTTVRGWWTVSKSKAGEILLKEAAAPPQYRAAAARLILKLAAGEKFTPAEITSLQLLHGFALLGSQKVAHQAIGHKILAKRLDQLMAQFDDDVKCDLADTALKGLGLL